MLSEEFLVLHGLRLKGMASCQALELAWGVEAEQHLARLAESGLCQFRDHPRPGYLLLPSGRERHAALLAEVRDSLAADACDRLHDLYRRFTPLNDEFKLLCTRWQMRGDVLNDHSDAEYDEACIVALEDLHARFLPLVLRAGRLVGHLERYPARFGLALTRLVEEGDRDYFTKPLVDSYHTVWFEFHEDLIATSGRQRQASES